MRRKNEDLFDKYCEEEDCCVRYKDANKVDLVFIFVYIVMLVFFSRGTIDLGIQYKWGDNTVGYAYSHRYLFIEACLSWFVR